MKLLTRGRRREQTTEVDAGPETATAGKSGESEDQTTSRRASTRLAFTRTQAMGWALRAALAAGPLALVLSLVASPDPVPPPPPAVGPSGNPAAEAAVSGFAEDYVMTWLTTPAGQESVLDRFVADAVLSTLPEQPREVSWSSVVDIEQPDQTNEVAWSVTVAAAVTDPADTSRRPGQSSDLDEEPGPVTRFFRVPVVLEDAAAVALTLPTPVAGPDTGPEAGGVTIGLAYEYRASLDEPVVSAAEDFVGALLTGSNDVSRYIAPDAPIAAIDPSPYTGVEVDEALADVDLVAEEDLREPETGAVVRLLLSGTAISEAAGESQEISVQYALTMTGRDGRWEVSAIDETPLLGEQSTDNYDPDDPDDPDDPGADPESGSAGGSPSPGREDQ